MAIRRMRDEETGEVYDIDLADDQPSQPEPEQPRSNAEWAAKRKAETRAEKAEKELAFLKAGINPDDPRAKWFVKGYDGKVEPDAIKSAALEAGILAAEPTPALDEVDTATLDAQGRISAAAAGAPPASAMSDEARLEDAMATGGVDAMLAVARELGMRTVGNQ